LTPVERYAPTANIGAFVKTLCGEFARGIVKRKKIK